MGHGRLLHDRPRRERCTPLHRHYLPDRNRRLRRDYLPPLQPVATGGVFRCTGILRGAQGGDPPVHAIRSDDHGRRVRGLRALYAAEYPKGEWQADVDFPGDGGQRAAVSRCGKCGSGAGWRGIAGFGGEGEEVAGGVGGEGEVNQIEMEASPSMVCVEGRKWAEMVS